MIYAEEKEGKKVKELYEEAKSLAWWKSGIY